MAFIQIPNLPAVIGLAGDELFEGVQAGTSVKISLSQIIAATRSGTPATLPIPVILGGTGVTTLTGYVKGSGTSPFTASATIPNTDITGLGTMSTQNANAVAITGGSVTGITDITVSDGGTGVSTLTGYVKGSGTSPLTASATIPSGDITGLGTMSVQDANNVTITGGSVTGITDITVSDGGTGVSTLTGYVKGSGTSPLTASATIPNTDISGLGTMSTQNSNAVSITGGTINGTTIGATTRSTANLTDLNVNGNTTLGDANTDTVTVNAIMGVSAAPVTAKGSLQVGTFNYTDTGVVAAFASSVVGSYNQIVLQNTNGAAGASTNVNVSNNLGTSTTNFGEFGMNSSAFGGTGSFGANGAVYVAAASTDLSIGTYSANAIHFVVNSGATDAMTISSTGLISGTGITALFASPPAIGSTVASTGAFTTLSASSTVSGTGFSTYLASPPAIGGTAAAAVTGAPLASTTVMTDGFVTLAAGTLALAFASKGVVQVTPNATGTFTTTVPPAGTRCTLIVLTSGTTSFTMTFGTGFKTTGTLATGTVTARYFIFQFISDGTSVIEASRTVAIA